MVRSGSFSRDRRYRYVLGRRWGSGAVLPWVMLNPSTADDAVDDPTTRRVIAFSRSWGYGGCTVVNLFAFRCADPRALSAIDDPIGHRNAVAVRAAIDDSAGSGCERIVVGWGVHGHRWLATDGMVGRRLRALVVAATAQATHVAMRPVALGFTAVGAPRHPLYLASTTPLQHVPAVPVRATS